MSLARSNGSGFSFHKNELNILNYGCNTLQKDIYTSKDDFNHHADDWASEAFDFSKLCPDP